MSGTGPGSYVGRVTPTRQGSFRLFRFAGIDVFLHWSWFVVAALEINLRAGLYSTPFWNALEYVALFAIVTLHEFGHSLACRQVGGQANQIVLWPLGGVAYVSPPPRPGATLWSIAAGPLVNVGLFPLFTGLWVLMSLFGGRAAWPNLTEFVQTLWLINTLLLAFNLLPIYPLDGGQILRSLLWFAVGRARSLLWATYVGFAGVVAMIALAIWVGSVWFGILAGFILLNCWSGLRQARALARAARAPRHAELTCPACGASPPAGAFWVCGKCRTAFDLFANHAVCPACGSSFGIVTCLECGKARPPEEWLRRA